MKFNESILEKFPSDTEKKLAEITDYIRDVEFGLNEKKIVISFVGPEFPTTEGAARLAWKLHENCFCLCIERKQDGFSNRWSKLLAVSATLRFEAREHIYPFLEKFQEYLNGIGNSAPKFVVSCSDAMNFSKWSIVQAAIAHVADKPKELVQMIDAIEKEMGLSLRVVEDKR